MKFLSVYSAVVIAAILGGSLAFGFEGRVPIYKSSEDKAPAQGNETAFDGVGPVETHNRIAAIDPELLWRNWSEPGSIPTAKSGTLEAPALIEKKSPRKRGAALLEFDAIVVWNGLEDANGRELLIFGSREKSIEIMKRGESDVALGIVPLNGKPNSIRRTGAEFESLKKLLELRHSYKYPQEDSASLPESFPERAPYCAFDLEINDVKTFAADVNNALKLRHPRAETSFSKENLAVVDAYLKRGIRNFVFDVFDFTEFDESSFTKTSLAVDFPTPRIFVPTAICKIGESTRTNFYILVLTPGDVKFAPGSWFDSSKGKFFWRTTFPDPKKDEPMTFSLEEFKKRAPTVAQFCEENGFAQLIGRAFLGEIDVRRTDGDFELVLRPESDESTTNEEAEDEEKPQVEANALKEQPSDEYRF